MLYICDGPLYSIGLLVNVYSFKLTVISSLNQQDKRYQHVATTTIKQENESFAIENSYKILRLFHRPFICYLITTRTYERITRNEYVHLPW